MMGMNPAGNWALFSVPIVGAFIIVKGTGLGVLVDIIVAACAITGLLSLTHIIDIAALLGVA